MQTRANGSATLTKLQANGRGMKDRLGDKMNGVVHDFGEKIGDLTSSLSSSATDAVDGGREYIEKNPVRSVAMAAAAGAALAGVIALVRGRR